MDWAADPAVNGLLADAALVVGVTGTQAAIAASPNVLKETSMAFNQRFHWTAVCPRCRRTSDFRHQALGGNLRRVCQRCPWEPPLRNLMTWWMETPRWRQRIVLEMLMAMEMDGLERDDTDTVHWRGHITTRRRWSSTVV